MSTGKPPPRDRDPHVRRANGRPRDRRRQPRRSRSSTREHPKGPAHNFATPSRPEIIQALAGQRADGTRHSETLGTGLIYAAVPITGGTDLGVKGAVRITYPSATLDARVRRTWAQLALLCLLVLCVVMARRLAARTQRDAARSAGSRTPPTASPLGDLDDARARAARTAGAAAPRGSRSTAWRRRSHACSTPSSSSSRTPPISSARRSPRSGCVSRTSTRASPTRNVRPSKRSIADVSRLSRLVDGLLVLARDDASGATAEVVDVSAVARARGDAWNDVVADRGMRARRRCAQSRSWATVAPGAVEQLVDNLVDNAVSVSHAGRHGHRPRRARRRARRAPRPRPGSGARRHEARSRAFDRFWRAPDAPYGGSGLGLAIVRRLAESSGGSARLDARPGGGIDAVVIVPASRPPAPDRDRVDGDAAVVQQPNRA